ncbi:hypothetical protein BGW36DRAFT_407380 [Talaromyces proteolyticus]|uniref:Uncharacterized protein n=1 Tax=Talaromyces proteolyticus TaxID=1131652 RepID=A0AAD4KQW4_9EURO|nr:uncharacterized protein BGW36DRAFT_407380 [Talaromyces proteolyticus]KAH8697325.1 hypothetical protein BGW36DRAFT_407380 [Talaromyces proteolyticus]
MANFRDLFKTMKSESDRSRKNDFPWSDKLRCLSLTKSCLEEKNEVSTRHIKTTTESIQTNYHLISSPIINALHELKKRKDNRKTKTTFTNAPGENSLKAKCGILAAYWIVIQALASSGNRVVHRRSDSPNVPSNASESVPATEIPGSQSEKTAPGNPSPTTQTRQNDATLFDHDYEASSASGQAMEQSESSLHEPNHVAMNNNCFTVTGSPMPDPFDDDDSPIPDEYRRYGSDLP